MLLWEYVNIHGQLHRVTTCRLSINEEPRSEALCLRNESDMVARFAGFLQACGMRWWYKVMH